MQTTAATNYLESQRAEHAAGVSRADPGVVAVEQTALGCPSAGNLAAVLVDAVAATRGFALDSLELAGDVVASWDQLSWASWAQSSRAPPGG